MEAKETFLGQFLQRLTTETPKFFKKIIAFGISLGAIGLALIAANAVTPLPKIIVDVAGYMVVAGTVATAVAKATTTNPTLQDAGGSLARTPRDK